VTIIPVPVSTSRSYTCRENSLGMYSSQPNSPR
jgi:hypothetical protein